jgi:hypothetical protein
MLKPTVDHLIAYVIPAARDYNDAEVALSAAFAAAKYDQTKCQADCELVKRRAAEVAVAIDGLADRAAHALGTTANAVRAQVAPLSAISGTVRHGCVERVCAVANIYKHALLSDPKHPIRSDADAPVIGAGWGIDGYGLGKYGGIEVMVYQTDGQQCKFLADVPYAIAGWFAFLKQQGASVLADRFTVCGLPVN